MVLVLPTKPPSVGPTYKFGIRISQSVQWGADVGATYCRLSHDALRAVHVTITSPRMRSSQYLFCFAFGGECGVVLCFTSV